MNEIIKINKKSIGESEINAVDARELHQFLEVKSEFRNWIKNRIKEYDFIENQDFISNGKNLPSGGRSIEYYISLDMAKELSMVERNEKGKQARKYFIECERKLKLQLPDFKNPAEAARAWALEYEKTLKLEAEKKVLQPKADVYDHAFANTLHSLQRVARTLEGVNTQQTKKDLLNLKYFYKRGGVYRVYHQFRGKLFEEKVDKHRGTVDIFVLDKGKQELVKLYKNRKLTMKKGY